MSPFWGFPQQRGLEGSVRWQVPVVYRPSHSLFPDSRPRLPIHLGGAGAVGVSHARKRGAVRPGARIVYREKIRVFKAGGF